jgi:mannitol/fructose-specific phosphotransferase system IIA component (Ntr-type)
MNLRDKLMENRILLPIQAATQSESIQELLVHLQTLDVLTATRKLHSAITEKEVTLPSAAGRGIAYPHYTSIEINELVCVLGISKKGLDFNSPDGQLCHIILLTLSPEDDPSGHRKFITRFRIMFDTPEVRFDLLEANHPREIMDIIQNWEDDEVKTDDLS